jgi:hypothetical protein
MNNALRPWQLAIVATFTALNCYALVKGIRTESFMGITAAVAGMIAVGYCIRICIKMNRFQEQLDEEEA